MWIWGSASQRLDWRIVFLVAAQSNTTDLKHYLFSATAHWKRKLCSERIDRKFNNTFFNFRSESPPVLWPCTFVNYKFCRSPGNGIFSPLFTASCLKSRAKINLKGCGNKALSEGVENSWLQLAPHMVSLIPTSCSTFTQQAKKKVKDQPLSFLSGTFRDKRGLMLEIDDKTGFLCHDYVLPTLLPVDD